MNNKYYTSDDVLNESRFFKKKKDANPEDSNNERVDSTLSKMAGGAADAAKKAADGTKKAYHSKTVDNIRGAASSTASNAKKALGTDKGKVAAAALGAGLVTNSIKKSLIRSTIEIEDLTIIYIRNQGKSLMGATIPFCSKTFYVVKSARGSIMLRPIKLYRKNKFNPEIRGTHDLNMEKSTQHIQRATEYIKTGIYEGTLSELDPSTDRQQIEIAGRKRLTDQQDKYRPVAAAAIAGLLMDHKNKTDAHKRKQNAEVK